MPPPPQDLYAFDPADIEKPSRSRGALCQSPARQAQYGFGRRLQALVPQRRELAGSQLDGGRITQVTARAVAGNSERLRPGAAMIFAQTRLVAERRAAVSVGHQQPGVAQPHEV